jgi:hypothetical protein
MIDWTTERIAALSKEALKNLRANAQAKGNEQVVHLCDTELSARTLRRKGARPHRTADESRRGQYVCGYHFVCPSEEGVTRNSDQTVWTGTWVVEKRKAEESSRYGAYVALHTSKNEPSYLQGNLKDSRVAKLNSEYADGRAVKIPMGVDLLFERSDEPYDWCGDGSGEKGYLWKNVPK